MTDSLCSLDYGEDLVVRFRPSGLMRREFAARAGILVSTLDYYVRRERRASLPGALPVNQSDWKASVLGAAYAVICFEGLAQNLSQVTPS